MWCAIEVRLPSMLFSASMYTVVFTEGGKKRCGSSLGTRELRRYCAAGHGRSSSSTSM